MTNSSKIIIVGAGLSGLTTAFLLQEAGETDFLVLEGRVRIGGRIFTKDAIDLGATWFQDHHSKLVSWLDKLSIPKHRQFQNGKSIFIYSSMAPPQYFDTGDPSNSAYRIAEGSQELIQKLAEPFSDKIHLETKVLRIEVNSDSILLQTSNKTYHAQKLILAMPPKLNAQIEFHPPLSKDILSTINQTHTWMSNAIKVGITYAIPFWRLNGYSGTIIGHVCPTIELYDHTNHSESTFHLMGFVNEGLRKLRPDNRKKRILDHIANQYGDQAYDYINYEEKDWSLDRMTSNQGLSSVYISPTYGHQIFQEAHYGGRIVFSGAETAQIHGGYMDGAIRSGERSFQLINEVK